MAAKLLSEQRHPIIRGLPPVIVVLVERGLDFADITSDWAAYSLWAVAGVLAVVLFWPWIRSVGKLRVRTPIYVPPPEIEHKIDVDSFSMFHYGDQPVVAIKPKQSSYYQDTGVSLGKLGALNEGLLEGKTFERCKIYGPAVLLLGGGPTSWHEIWLEADPKDAGSLFLELPEEALKIGVAGAIRVVDCRFSHCAF